jgi:hypothetical protein
LAYLDKDLEIGTTAEWLENTQPTTNAGTQSTNLEKSVQEIFKDDIFPQYFEEYIQNKNRKTTSYYRFLIKPTGNTSELVVAIKDELWNVKNRTIFEVNNLPEIIDFCAGWLLGCDPKFLSADVVKTELLIKAGKDTVVPDFYITKMLETLFLNKESGVTKAPVIKLMCQGNDLATLRGIFAGTEINGIFSGFVKNDDDLDIKWARLNDHIDMLKDFRYIAMQDDYITQVSNILDMKCEDDKPATLKDIFMAKGILPITQETTSGTQIFAQCKEAELEGIMKWLSTELGMDSPNKWEIFSLNKTEPEHGKG